MAGRILVKLTPSLPQYHTRAMRKAFVHQVQQLGVNIPPHMIRIIYRRLALDSTADQNPDLDERIKLALASDEPELLLDLRHLNKGRPKDTFKEFFTKLCDMIDEWAAADERHHGIAHMAQFLSVGDLVNKVKESLPVGTAVPSESTVLLSFAPRNISTAAARHYTGKVVMVHKVQSLQLRNYNADFHYCFAQFKYLREMAIKYKDSCLLLSCDDKAKVMMGEPGLGISTGVRGRQSLVPSSIVPAALDHDVNQKASVVPSVMLDIKIPDIIEETFYRGQVAVTLNDAVFQTSSPNRFVSEVLKYWESLANEKRECVKLLFLVTDGGPEHRMTFESVKISLIHIFRKTNVDLLIALRMAAGQSFANPVERIMSVLNIALQNVAIMRVPMSEGVESVLKSCGTMDAIRKKEQQVGEEWGKSVQPTIDTLAGRFARCSLKDVPFIIQPPTTQAQIKSVIDTMLQIDPNLEAHKLQKAHTTGKAQYQDFKRMHCRERNYTFQVGSVDVQMCLCHGTHFTRNSVFRHFRLLKMCSKYRPKALLHVKLKVLNM